MSRGHCSESSWIVEVGSSERAEWGSQRRLLDVVLTMYSSVPLSIYPDTSFHHSDPPIDPPVRSIAAVPGAGNRVPCNPCQMSIRE